MDQPRTSFDHWRKSTRSGGSANCVEFAHQGATVGIRDSKNPDAAVLEFPADVWNAFVAGIKAGEFDMPGKP
ncbi:DUF397 domain-containing protein [Hamadaea sp. NPDC050747]|uniref:DUF397 domain-containing protein n=1 Tax=Hamadaea sp. NPDC050747 TaxID=3155789 RepID=UPI0033FB8D30